MRAFAVRNFGEAPALHDLPTPDADNAFLIRVTYAGINPLDNILAERLTATSKYPFVLAQTSPVSLNALRTENSVSAPANESSAWPERTERTPNTLPSRPG